MIHTFDPLSKIVEGAVDTDFFEEAVQQDIL
jgi:hypothetical protein